MKGVKSDPRSLSEILRCRAELTPEKTAYRFLAETSLVESALTYAQLETRATQIAFALDEFGLTRTRLGLLFPTAEKFVGAFFGTLRAGSVAIPLSPRRLNSGVQALQSILDDADVGAILTDDTTLQKISSAQMVQKGISHYRVLSTDQIPWDAPTCSILRDPLENDLAVLQYTSGSTNAPKGVKVTNANFINNASIIAGVGNLRPDSEIVSWLPLFHDMGLVGSIVLPLCAGVEFDTFVAGRVSDPATNLAAGVDAPQGEIER